MKLHSITIKNVKSFREQVTFKPHKEFNVLIGSNGSGKSNLMEIVYITLRHFFIFTYRWSTERAIEGLRVRIDRDSSPFGVINHVLTKYIGDISQSELILELEVSDYDLQNIRLIQQNLDSLKAECSNFHSIDVTLRNFLDSNFVSLNVGERFTYKVLGNNFQQTNEDKPRFYLSYLRSIEGLSFLAQNLNLALHPLILYISPFRGVSNLALEQSLADNNSKGEQTEVMKSTSRSTSSLIKLATLYFAEKRRKFEYEAGDTNAKWGADKEVRFVSDSLAKIGYTWDMDLIDPNRNTYTIRLKKDGNVFLLNQASSGEVELINFILGMITLGLKGGIIIVDEPELHLHPKWIAFLRGFFMQYAFTEKNQLMIVTHSGTFINSSTYPYITRVYKNGRGSSDLHQVVDENREETKERLHFINATNNEKVFFSDFVVMVEGDTDEIVFKQILEVIKKESGFKSNVEVMQVRGKTNYEKFNSFLKTLQIESCFIGDLDNVAQMATGNEVIKHMLITNEKRIERLVIKNPGSKDNLRLTQLLEDAINTDDLAALKGFYDYMISFRQKLRDDITSEERQELEKFVGSLYDQNIYLLRKGEIEAYFPEGFKGKDLDKVLVLTQGSAFEQWKNEEGFKALKNLIIMILQRNHIM